jgi:casein kinase 1
MDQSYDPSTAPVISQNGLQPISPMNVNSRGGGTAANSQQNQGGAGEGDYADQRKGGNKFVNFLLCRGCS